jgi:hypothetical protein
VRNSRNTHTNLKTRPSVGFFIAWCQNDVERLVPGMYNESVGSPMLAP